MPAGTVNCDLTIEGDQCPAAGMATRSSMSVKGRKHLGRQWGACARLLPEVFPRSVLGKPSEYREHSRPAGKTLLGFLLPEPLVEK